MHSVGQAESLSAPHFTTKTALQTGPAAFSFRAGPKYGIVFRNRIVYNTGAGKTENTIRTVRPVSGRLCGKGLSMAYECVHCKTPVNDGDARIFGLIERNTYDSRTNDAQFLTKSHTYQPVALARIPLCSGCRKKLLLKIILRNLLYLAIAPVIITLLNVVPFLRQNAGAVNGGILGLVWGILWLAACIFFIRGVTGLVQLVLKGDGLVASDAVGQQIPAAFVLCPPAEEDISVRSAVGGRTTLTYDLVSEKNLRKPLKEKAAKGSKTAALNTLRTWAKEHGVFS